MSAVFSGIRPWSKAPQIRNFVQFQAFFSIIWKNPVGQCRVERYGSSGFLTIDLTLGWLALLIFQIEEVVLP